MDYTVVSSQALKFNVDFEVTKMDLLYTDNQALLSTIVIFVDKSNVQKVHLFKKAQKPELRKNKKSDFFLTINDS